jgi:hypothetical protein
MPTDTERLDWIASQKARIEFSDYLVQCITKDNRAHTYHTTPIMGKAGNTPDIYPIGVALRRSIDALMKSSPDSANGNHSG